MKTAIALPITLAVTAATSSAGADASARNRHLSSSSSSSSSESSSSKSSGSKSSKSSNPLGLATGDVYNWFLGTYVLVDETFISLLNGDVLPTVPVDPTSESGTLTIERLESTSGLAFQSTYQNSAIRLVSEGVASYNPKFSDEVELYCDHAEFKVPGGPPGWISLENAAFSDVSTFRYSQLPKFKDGEYIVSDWFINDFVPNVTQIFPEDAIVEVIGTTVWKKIYD